MYKHDLAYQRNSLVKDDRGAAPSLQKRRRERQGSHALAGLIVPGAAPQGGVMPGVYSAEFVTSSSSSASQGWGSEAVPRRAGNANLLTSIQISESATTAITI